MTVCEDICKYITNLKKKQKYSYELQYHERVMIGVIIM